MNEARQYLQSVVKLDKLIANKLKEIEQWRSIAEGTSVSANADRVQTSPKPDKMENAVIRFVDLQNKANEMIDKYIDMKEDVISLIEAVDDAIMYDILHKRYIDNIPLVEIAYSYDVSVDTINRKHKKALKKVQEIMDERKKRIDGQCESTN